MNSYTFSKPIQEGVLNGKKFFVIEVSENGKVGVLRRKKISIGDARILLNKIFSDPVYQEKV